MTEGDTIYRSVWRQVLLVLTILIVLSSIDRVNVSFAALHMNADLGLSKSAYGLGVSLFFVGYLVFQVPSVMIFERIGPRRWIAGTVILWGVVATAMAFIDRPWEFYTLRFVLGLCESGFAPGVVVYVSRWLPSEYRARAVGVTLLAVPISVVVGGPLSGLLLTIDAGSIAGWRWMYFLEGLPTILLGIFAFFWFVDSPAQARWLTPAQKLWISSRVDAERRTAGERAAKPLWVLIRDPLLWPLAALWFVLLTGSNALIFWLPQILKSLTTMGEVEIGVVTALPWIMLGLGMWGNARKSDMAGERLWHVGVPTAAAGVGLLSAILLGAGAWGLIALLIAGLGLGAAQSVFWTLPTRTFTAAPGAIVLINLCGNMSGVLTPLAFGAMSQRTGTAWLPVVVVAAMLVAATLLLLPLRIARPVPEVAR